MDQKIADLDPRLVDRIWWRIIPLLSAVMMMNYLDRSNIGFAALSMNGALNFAPHIFGAGVTIFFIGYIAVMVPSNLVVQRVGARRWLPLLIVGWGLTSISTAWVTGPTGFYVNRFLLGIFEAGFQPGVLYFLTLWFSDKHRAGATAAFMLSSTFVGIIGSPLSASLLGLDGWFGLQGWQWLFLIEGAPSVLLGILVYFMLADSPEEAKWLTEREAAVVRASLSAESRDEPRQGSRILSTLARGDLQLLAACYFFIGIAVWTVVFWMPQIIQQRTGSDHLRTGLLTSLPYLSAAIATFAVGKSSDRQGERMWHVAGILLLGAAGMLLVATGGSAWTAVLGMCLAAVGVFAFIGPFWALVSQLVRPELRASAIAIIGLTGPLGGAVGPLLVGWLREWTGDFRLSMAACATAMALAAVLAIVGCRMIGKIDGTARSIGRVQPEM